MECDKDAAPSNMFSSFKFTCKRHVIELFNRNHQQTKVLPTPMDFSPLVAKESSDSVTHYNAPR